MVFSELKLDPRLERAIKSAGFTEATPIQKAAIPAALTGKDLVGTAQTGTGKTAAFALPMLQRLVENPPKQAHTRALILTPTRELAEQVESAIRSLAKYTKVRSATVYGGVGYDNQRRALRKGTDIIVACPGRLIDHIEGGNADLGAVEILVLDEADRMLDMGFLPSVRKIIARTPRQRQTLLFSATFDRELDRLVSDVTQDPERIEIGMRAPAQTVDHTIFPVDPAKKTPLLLRLLEETETASVLIFTRTKHRADRLARQVCQAGHRAGVLHSDKSQSQRQQALESFRKGRVPVLVATDIAARGLDIDSISHVINYDIPGTVDEYIHRIGRTGRANRTGDALTLVTMEERRMVLQIEQALGEPLSVRRIEGFGSDFDLHPPQRQAPGRSRIAPSRPKSAEARPKGPVGGPRRIARSAAAS